MVMTNIFSQKLYHPIRRLITLMSNTGFSATISGPDEINFLEENFRTLNYTQNTLINKIDKIEREMHKYILKKILLHSNENIDEQDIQNTFTEYHIFLDKEYFCAAILNIHFKIAFFEKYLPDTQKLILNGICRDLEYQLQSQCAKIYISDLEEYRFFILLNDNSHELPQLLHSIFSKLNEILLEDQQYIKISYQISDIHDSILHLGTEFREMNEDFQYYLLSSKSSIISTQTLDRSTSIYIPENFEESLKNNVISGNTEGLHHLISLFFQTNKAAGTTVYRFRKMQDILQTIYQSLSDICEICPLTQDPHKKLVEKLYDFDALQQIFEELFQQLCSCYPYKEKTKGMEMIEYIEENFQNPNLNLQTMADDFHMNSNYLSRVFKSETGNTFTDYLCTIRINKAKQLIIDTESLIDDISEQVGICSRRTFNRLFKKIVGVSPAMYRILNRPN